MGVAGRLRGFGWSAAFISWPIDEPLAMDVEPLTAPRQYNRTPSIIIKCKPHNFYFYTLERPKALQNQDKEGEEEE